MHLADSFSATRPQLVRSKRTVQIRLNALRQDCAEGEFTFARAILRFSSAAEIGGSDVGLTGRTAFPPRQMEKETRLMEAR